VVGGVIRWTIIGGVGCHEHGVEAFGQRRVAPAWRITRGPQGRAQQRKERMHPLIDLALRELEQLPMIHLGRVLLEVTQDEQQAILGSG